MEQILNRRHPLHVLTDKIEEFLIMTIRTAKEELLEPLLRKMRINRVVPIVKQYPFCSLLDIGCGWEARFLLSIENLIAEGFGIDFKAPEICRPKISTISAEISKKLPFEDSRFDVVTLLAVLEHFFYPEDILQEINRVLKPGGVLVGTVPSKIARPVLEFLSYRLHIINPDEISDHKFYYDKNSLTSLLHRTGFIKITHKYFQLGMNNFFLAYTCREGK